MASREIWFRCRRNRPFVSIFPTHWKGYAWFTTVFLAIGIFGAVASAVDLNGYICVVAVFIILGVHGFVFERHCEFVEIGKR